MSGDALKDDVNDATSIFLADFGDILHVCVCFYDGNQYCVEAAIKHFMSNFVGPPHI